RRRGGPVHFPETVTKPMAQNAATYPLVFSMDAPTRIKGAEFILSPGDVIKLDGGPVGRHRKQIVITNEDNVDKPYIIEGEKVDPKGPTDVKYMTLFPNTAITLFTNSTIWIKAPAAGATVNYIQVLETFYTGEHA